MSQSISAGDFSHFIKIEEITSSNRYIFWVEKSSKSDLSGYNKRIFRYDKLAERVIPFTAGIFHDFNPKISPDEAYICFISNRFGSSQLFLQLQEGGEAYSISKKDLQIKSFAWNPKSTKIAYIANKDPKIEEINSINDLDKEYEKISKLKLKREREDPRRIKDLIYRTGTSFIEDWLHSQIFVYDLITKENTRISSLDFDYHGIEWIDVETVISVTKFDKPEDISDWLDVVKLNIDGESKGTRIARSYHPYIFDKSLSVNHHNTSMILIQTYLQNYNSGLRYQNLKWGLITENELEIINKDFDRSVVQLDWVSSTKAVVSVHTEGFTELRQYNYDDASFEKFYETKFSIETFSANSLDDIVVVGTSPNHPSAIWTFDNGEFLLFYDPNKQWLENKKIFQPEEFWLQNEEGVKFQGWFFDASDTSNQDSPLILSIHGGPHIMWNNAGTMWLEWQSQLNQGYSILAMNPVGSDGYGEDFLRVIVGNWGKKDARDLLQALDHFVKTKNIDENRIYVTGGSYAGLQTANLIGITQRFRAACAQRGVYNLLTLDAGGDLARFEEIEYTGEIDKDVNRLWNDSPISKVANMKTPLLLIHSENDYRVPIHQAEQLFMELRRRGVEVEFIRYPDEGHELSRGGKPRRLIDRIERIIEWFNSHS